MAAREQDAIQREDVRAAAPAAITTSAAPGPPAAGHLRPNLSPAMVMRLQAGAGNAAVSALIDDHRPATKGRLPRSAPTEADAALMAAMATRSSVAREPVAQDETVSEETVPTGPEPTAEAVPPAAPPAAEADETAAGVPTASPQDAAAPAAAPAASAAAAAAEPAAPAAAAAAAPAAPAAAPAPAPAAAAVASPRPAAASLDAPGAGAASPVPASASAAPGAGAQGRLDLGGADGGEAGGAAEGPSEDDLAALETELGEAESQKTDTEPEPEGPVLARVAIEAPAEAPEAQDAEEPTDSGAIAAEAQGDLEALGASGGDEAAGIGGGGGGGGAPVEDKPEPPAPNVSNADPARAVAAAGSLKPAQMLETLGGAEQAAENAAAKEHKALAAAPPTANTGGGDGPSADERHPDAPPARPRTNNAAAKSGGEPPTPKPVAAKPKAPLAPAPPVQGDAKGNVSKGDAARIQSSIANLPVRDAGAAIPNTPAPKVALTGEADPAQMAEQEGHLKQTVAQATAQGRAEAAEPAGEDSLAPTVRPETIKAEIATAPAGSAPANSGGPTDDEAASAVAEEQSGSALRAAVAQASGQVAQHKQQHAATAAQHRAAAKEEVAAQHAKSQADQIAEHAAAKAGVTKARGEWTGEQKAAATAAQAEARGAVTEATGHIAKERAKADAEAVKHIESGRKEAEQAKQQGEDEAAREREKAKKESSGGGFFGWVKSKATALYNSVKDGITNIFNRVRSAISAAINKARELATNVIKSAVKFVADKIKAVAGKLVAIGDKLIPGFAALRRRFKTWIVNRIKQAVAALNRIVTAVKNGIRRTLQAVGKALSAAVDLLKKGMQAAINAVKNVVKAAIEKAKAAIAALGTFAVLVKDIASNPGQWLRNLGASIMDGIRNHLWKALKSAVAQWFNDKVEQVLGLGKTVWNLLRKGGVGLAQVGKMAWEAIKAAIPPALIAILIERLVSMIVPAAGAVMAIVQGLVAAWGAIQRIIAAIDRFVAFLKAVKSGNAGPAFANALAAAAVAVIEFVSQFLLRKIAGAASKVAGKIRAIAQKIGKRLMAAVKKVGKAIKRGAKRVKGAFKRGTQKLRDRFGGGKKKKREDERQKKQERLDKAIRAIRPQLAELLRKGTSRLRLRAKLLYWRVRYRLSELTMLPGGAFKAKVNPETVLDDPKGHTLSHEELGRILQPIFAQAEREFARRLEANPEAAARMQQAREAREQNAPSALGGTRSRFEQQRALRDSAPTPPHTDKAMYRTHPEQDVAMSVRTANPGDLSTSMVQNIERYHSRTTKTGRTVLSIAAKLTQNASKYGITDQHLAMLLSAKPHERAAVTQLIEHQMRPFIRAGVKKDRDEAARFLRMVHRVTFLTTALEPARSEGVGLPMAVAHTLWDRNRPIEPGGRPITAEDIMGEQGSLAPMTPVGAAAGDPDAVRKRHERIGAIFDHLLGAAKRHEIIVAQGGYNVTELGSAVQLWLAEHLRPIRDEDQLATAEVILQAELLRFLTSYHGTG